MVWVETLVSSVIATEKLGLSKMIAQAVVEIIELLITETEAKRKLMS